MRVVFVHINKDGLNDGEEMGPVMEENQGEFKGRHYYYLFSYPSPNGFGFFIPINSFDSYNDGLSDKAEYDFGSSGIDKDTDNDNLNDFEEHRLGPLPRDPDTDRDGLTDGWETTADPENNEYGATDPLNRDSDFDKAIDGGESNIYPGKPIDIDGETVSNSFPYMWDTFASGDGSHTIRINAVDRAGNTASKEIMVTVDNTLPEVEIKFP
ncbi:MAG: hypothetical protein KAJ19_14255, partial [Gammaproteobacteria bacterium]|nr:hypothetical protein [Gammaproteobacteria bacterium]